jgi:hypothetical protein
VGAVADQEARGTPPSRPRLRDPARFLARPTSALWIAAAGILVGATALLGFTTLFSNFTPSDDEGYFLETVKGYLSGAKLYDQTNGAYGPFYFEFMAAIYKALGLAVTNSNGRVITLYLWIASSFLLGVAAYRLTRNAWIGAAVYLLAFWTLNAVPGEPSSASHVTMFLLAAMVTVAAFLTEPRSRIAFALLGGLAAATALTKVNIGAFAIASLVFAAVLASPRLARSRALVIGISTCFVLVPPVVMLRNVVQPGYLLYATHVLLGALAVALVAIGTARGDESDDGAASWLVYAALGAVAVSVVVCGVVLIQGTSLSGLIHGPFVGAASSFEGGALHISNPLPLPGNVIGYDAVGLALAAAVMLGAFPRSSPWPRIGSLARIGVGIWIWAELLGSRPLAIPVALVWVAAVPTHLDGPTAARRFARLFVPALAVLQVLHAFPVPGSQIRFAAFLLVVVGGICVGDGLAELGVFRLGLGAPAQRLAAAGAIGLLIWVAFEAVASPLAASVQTYRHSTALNVPGDTWIRMPAATAQQYEGVVNTLKSKCKTFVTMPGAASLYLMSGEAPPTWNMVFSGFAPGDDQAQQRLVDQLKQVPGLCAVRYPGLEPFWTQGQPVPDSPIRSFILDDFKPLATFGYMAVLTRTGS